MHFECRLVEIDYSDSYVTRLVLSRPKGFNYLAGQYVNIMINDELKLPFSLASSGDEEFLLFHLCNNSSSWAYKQIIKQVLEHERITITPAAGNFVLDNPSSSLVLISGGCSFSPCQSLISHISSKNIQKNITVYWVVKEMNQCYELDFLQAKSLKLKNFDFVIIENEQAETFDADKFSAQIISNLVSDQKFQIFASGPPGFVKVIFNALLKGGVSANYLYTDSVAGFA